MHSSNEQQGEIRKPSSESNAKKQRKTIGWERLESLQEYQRHQGNISCKDEHNKDRSGMDLTEAKHIKKRWQEYTELYKKSLNDLDNHDGVITHLEPQTSWNVKSSGPQKASL